MPAHGPKLAFITFSSSMNTGSNFLFPRVVNLFASHASIAFFIDVRHNTDQGRLLASCAFCTRASFGCLSVSPDVITRKDAWTSTVSTVSDVSLFSVACAKIIPWRRILRAICAAVWAL